jgi:hypothetical protein
VVRIVYLAAYAFLAALGEALVARPALVWLRSLGLRHAVLPWSVPLGPLVFAVALLLALLTLFLAAQAALGERPRMPQHAVFLLVLGGCFALRYAGIEPLPPADPAPRMYAALRSAADALDNKYAGHYDTSGIEAAPSPFCRFGRTAPVRLHVIESASGPQTSPLPGDESGTIYIALSPDRTTAWLTALSNTGVLRAAIESHSGTHSLPGRDRLVPAYPGMRSALSPR